MSAFDASDFEWQGSRRSLPEKEGGSRDHKRRRSRSRDRSRRRRGSRHRSPDSRRDRRYRSISPRGDRREAVLPSSYRDEATANPTTFQNSHSTSTSADGNNNGVLSHHARPPRIITQLPFEHCGQPQSDWWCPTCSNPNPQMRWDCQKCGSLHTTETSIRPTTELMSDFITPVMVSSMLFAARRGEYSDCIAPADLAGMMATYERAVGGSGSPDQRRDAEMRAIEVLVQSVLKGKAECNPTLMYACVAEEAQSAAVSVQPALVRVGVGIAGGSAPLDGYVVCVRFYSVADAKQCLLGLQSCVVLPGLTAHGGGRFAMDGRLRLGFSTRRSIPKPPPRPYASSAPENAPILDIHEEKPIAEAPSVWAPPTFHSDNELKAFLVQLFNQWDSILPAQKEFYEANISKVTQQRQQPAAQASPVVQASTISAMSPSLHEGPLAMKKKLEEKRLELAAKRKLLESQQGEAVQALPQPPVLAPVAPSSAGGLSVLEKLAQKKALLQQQQQQQISSQQASAHTSQIQEQSAPVAPPPAPAALLVHQLVPMPPNFPSKTDYAKQCKLINPKVLIKLNGIPMDVASRVLNPKFL